MSKFYITTPIYYASGDVHVGHTYTTVAADVLARYHRLIGDKTFFATGTDEHGAKIEEKAIEAGKKPQKFVDEIAAQFKEAWDKLNISYDRFIRTTEKEHVKAVQNALQYMKDKGDIYLGKYEGLYCQECEQYKSEKDLVNGKCPEHQIEPKKISEETYMFKMTKYANDLLKRIESDAFKIRPIRRKNEIISFYKNEGLKDVSFSRKKVKWGVPIPWDKNHFAYVWSDAFLNYLTILDWNGTGGKYPKMFPPEAQIMAKDILRVHATIWPAMLLSLDLPLPKQLLVHGFLLVDGQKMSKSLGNVISPDDLMKKYGADATKYLLMSATTFERDGDISWKKLDDKYNADLANGLGNLVSRVLNLAAKKGVKYSSNKEFIKKAKDEERLAPIIDSTEKDYKNLLNEFKLFEALEEIWGLITLCDRYLEGNKPWMSSSPEDAKNVLSNALFIINKIANLIAPFLPETSEKIKQSLGRLRPTGSRFAEGKEGQSKSGKSEVLFPRI